MKIEVTNLRREFGDTVAVDDVSFRFGAGQIFGFVGPNGAGKTTTMRIMATLDEPTAGDVLLDGRSVPVWVAVFLKGKQDGGDAADAAPRADQ